MNVTGNLSTSKRKRGFVALTSTLIIGAVLLSIVLGVASRLVTGAIVSVSESTYHRATSLAELCAEHALLELERSIDYSGGVSIPIGSESCDVVSVDGSGNTNRTIKVESTVLEHTSRIIVTVSEISPVMTLSSWARVSEF